MAEIGICTLSQQSLTAKAWLKSGNPDHAHGGHSSLLFYFFPHFPPVRMKSRIRPALMAKITSRIEARPEWARTLFRQSHTAKA